MAKKGKMGDNSIVAGDLQEYMDRLDNLVKEREDTNSDIREVYLEMKNKGYNTKAIKRLRAIMAKDLGVHREEGQVVRMYADVLNIEIDPFS